MHIYMSLLGYDFDKIENDNSVSKENILTKKIINQNFKNKRGVKKKQCINNESHKKKEKLKEMKEIPIGDHISETIIQSDDTPGNKKYQEINQTDMNDDILKIMEAIKNGEQIELI